MGYAQRICAQIHVRQAPQIKALMCYSRGAIYSTGWSIMRPHYNNPTPPGGISRKNRELLNTLVRSTRGPFTVEEGKDLLSLSGRRTRRLLAYLVARRWLARVRPGVYVVSPMELTKPHEWREDPWIVANKTLAP